MTFYRIVSPHFVASVITNGHIVLQSAPVLGWTVGKTFPYVRDYCAARGWSVEPLDEPVHPDWLEVDGRVYELLWHGEALSRISLHEDGEVTELGYDELPEQLKELL